jgi:ferrochelatase
MKPLQDRDHWPEDHPDIVAPKIGVLIVNLGTPEATDYWSMRRYLKEFLSDRRVIEVSRPIWWLVLNGIILTTRPSRSGAAYDLIWNKELDESPLKTVTRLQADKLSDALTTRHPQIVVDWAMRYGKPPIAEGLERLKSAGCERILLFPLYPQYSASTTATVNDKAFEALTAMRWQPALRFVPPYYDDPSYIDALANSVTAHLETLDWQPDAILASFHGLPREYLDKGDPYHCHCQKTGRLLREALGRDERSLMTVFQSRFGRAEWLQPYTAETIAELAGAGVRNLAVLTPGFASDCVETLEEIAMQGAETFHEHGGENFCLIPCLNGTDASIAMLAGIIQRELQGWL